MEDWRYGPLGRAGVLRSSGEDSDDEEGDWDDEAPPALSPAAGLSGAEAPALPPSPSSSTSSPSRRAPLFPGSEPEGMEDWRYGPVGRFNAARAAGLELEHDGGGVAASCRPPAAAAPTAAAVAAGDAGGTGTVASGSLPAERGTARRAASSSAVGTGANEDLFAKFQRLYNAHSSPRCGLSGEVRPRTIWGYWAQGYAAMPEVFKLCVDTWRGHNPHWDVRILEDANLYDYLSEADLPNRFSEIPSPQTASDCVRLALLARYGGVWLDASVVLRCGLDALCWRALSADGADPSAGAAFFEPRCGCAALGGEDFLEGWCLATLPGNPLIFRWRDLLRELLHNRVDVKGLLRHPLYRGLDLKRLSVLSGEALAGGHVPRDHDLREELAMSVMFQHLLQRDGNAHQVWLRTWHRFDSSRTALALQGLAQEKGVAVADLLLEPAYVDVEDRLRDVPLIKLTTPDYLPLVDLPRERLRDGRSLIGRLLSFGVPAGAGLGAASSARAATTLAAAGRVATAAAARRWAPRPRTRGAAAGIGWTRPLPRAAAAAAASAVGFGASRWLSRAPGVAGAAAPTAAGASAGAAARLAARLAARRVVRPAMRQAPAWGVERRAAAVRQLAVGPRGLYMLV